MIVSLVTEFVRSYDLDREIEMKYFEIVQAELSLSQDKGVIVNALKFVCHYFYVSDDFEA